MTTIDYNWTDAPESMPLPAATAPAAISHGPLSNLIAELRAVMEGMFIQVAPNHDDALGAPLRRDIGLD